MEKIPRCYLLFHNIAKPKNVGSMIRSACAFNVTKIFLISKDPEKKKDSKIMKAFGVRHGAQGTEDRIDYGFFFSIQEAKTYFNDQGIQIVGIEIGNNAKNIFDKEAFQGDTVFVMGNEGDGIHPPLKAICDYFIYIPQYTSKTASLNVAAAGAIVLHHFARYAGYKEQQVFGEKFRRLEEDQEERIEKINRGKEIMGKREKKGGEEAGSGESIDGSEENDGSPEKKISDK